MTIKNSLILVQVEVYIVHLMDDEFQEFETTFHEAMEIR